MTAATSKKASVQAEYGLDDHGLITAPGRYEREPWYLVALDEMKEDKGFGNISKGSRYFSLYILNPDEAVDAEIIAETGKRGFILSLNHEDLRFIEAEYDTEAEAHTGFDALQREYITAPRPAGRGKD